MLLIEASKDVGCFCFLFKNRIIFLYFNTRLLSQYENVTSVNYIHIRFSMVNRLVKYHLTALRNTRRFKIWIIFASGAIKETVRAERDGFFSGK